jgi:multiple sugar transport system substrate-binding protein
MYWLAEGVFFMVPQRLSRRSLLKSAIVVGAATSMGPLLEACGGGSSSTSSNSSTTVTLQMWSGPEGVAMRPIVARWNSEMRPKTGITLQETEPSRAGYDALITSQLLSKSGTPDIVFPFNWDVARVAKAGTLVDLTPYINKDPSGFQMDDFFKVAVDSTNIDGHQYALPLDMSLPILYYRKDLISTPPDTWDEFLQMADKFTKSRNSSSPTRYGTTLYAHTGVAEAAQLWEEILWPYGGQLADSSFHWTIASDAGVKATNVGRTLVQRGNVPQPVTSYEYPQVLAALTNGSVAFIQEWNAAWGQIIDKTQNPSYFDKIQYAPIPGVSQSDGTVKRAYHVHTINLAVNASSKHVDQAVEVLKWLLRPDVAVAYTVAGGNTPRQSIFNSPDVAKVRPGFQSWLATQVSDSGQLEPKLAEMPDIDDLIMNQYLNAAWAGQMDPMAALSAAQDKINALLKKDGVQQ